MASGYTVSGRGDLDTIFATRVSAAGPATGFLVGGTDLNQRYEPRGSTTPVSDTRYKSAGTDLALLFKDKSAISNTITLGSTLSVSIMAGAATATYSLTNAGAILYSADRDGTVTTSNWISPLSNFGNFSVRATLLSGPTPASGTLNTWLNLATTRTWTAVASTTAIVAASNLTIEIRSDADGIVRASAPLTLQPYCCTHVLTSGWYSGTGEMGFSNGRATGHAFGSLSPTTALGKTVTDAKELGSNDPDFVFMFALESSTALTKGSLAGLTLVSTQPASGAFYIEGADFSSAGSAPLMYRWRFIDRPVLLASTGRFGLIVS